MLQPPSAYKILQVVTCSGIATDGSLRIVRNGIGMVGQATIELSGIRGLWSLRASFEDRFDSFLVLTFVGETRLLAMNEEDELEEAEPEGFDADSQVGFQAAGNKPSHKHMAWCVRKRHAMLL